jgi:hypothetical protein
VATRHPGLNSRRPARSYADGGLPAR